MSDAVGAVRRASDLGINFDHWCFACGGKNPCGLRVELGVTADGVELRYAARREHTGYEDTLHGGVLVTLLDEAMAWAVFLHLGTWGVTTRLAATLRKPVAVGEDLVVTSHLERDRGRAVELRALARREPAPTRQASARKTDQHAASAGRAGPIRRDRQTLGRRLLPPPSGGRVGVGRARADGEVVAEGSGSYVKMPEAKVRELILKYGEPKLVRATLLGERR